MKRCARCGHEKKLSSFYRSRRSADGRTVWCRSCVADYYQEHRGEKLSYQARKRVLTRYGLDLDEYLLLIAGGCAVCGSTERVGIDHDHARHAVRAPLCHNCNMVLGYAKDDATRLRALADYVEHMAAEDLPTIPKYVGMRSKALPPDEVAAMYDRGMTQVAIAAHFDCSQAHVANTMKSLGLKARRRGPRPASQ